LISLSARQQQIAGLVAAGCTNDAIARSLQISVWTVSTHLRRIFAKLAVSNRAEMVAHLLARSDLAGVIETGALASNMHRPEILQSFLNRASSEFPA
jgi:DNA-binding CsgD family transcriptional regulator